MIQTFGKIKYTTLFTLPLLINSCAIYGPLWDKTQWTGPIVVGNEHAKIVKKCTRDPVYIRCKTAFVDHNGDKVELINDVQSDIDNYIRKIPQLAPWVKVRSNTSRSLRAQKNSRIPYSFHIITISPLVVLVTPRDLSESDRCSSAYKLGCMNTRVLTLEPYWYQSTPSAKNNSFWFSPDLDKGPVLIPKDIEEYKIKLHDSVLEFESNNGIWNIQRNSLKTKQDN